MGWIVSPQKSYTEVLIHSTKMWLFGDKAFKEVIRLKWHHEDGPQPSVNGISFLFFWNLP